MLIANQAIAFHIKVIVALRFVTIRVLLLAKDPFAADDIGKNRVSTWNRMGESLVWWKTYIEIFGTSDNIPHRPSHSAHRASNNFDGSAAGIGHFWDFAASYPAIAWVHHLIGGWQVRPELEAVHGS